MHNTPNQSWVDIKKTSLYEDIEIKYLSLCLEGKIEERPYQPHFATVYALRKNNICSGEMGIGKTIITCLTLYGLYYNKLPLNRTSIVIVPPNELSASLRWQPELEMFFPANFIGIGDEGIGKPIWILKNTSSIRKHLDYLMSQLYLEMLVIDEAHNLKPGTQQSHHYFKLRQITNRCLLISGTLSDGRLNLLYHLISLCYRDFELSLTSFRKLFGCPTELPGWNSNSLRRLDNLHPAYLPEYAQFLDKYIHRITYSNPEINVSIPSFASEIVCLTLDEQERKEYDLLLQDVYSTRVVNNLHKVYSQVALLPKKLACISNLSYAEHSTNRTTLIYYNSITVGDAIEQSLSSHLFIDSNKVYRLHAGLSLSERIKIVNSLNYIPGAIGICSINLISESIDLLGVSTVVMYELSWQALQYKQALHRVIRPGNNNKIKVKHIYYKDTIEEYMFNLLQHKLTTGKLTLECD